MPIDFSSIVHAPQPSIQREVLSIEDSFARLGDRLSRQLDRYSSLELSTRAFPTILFHAEAVSTWIDPQQHGLLAPAVPPAEAWRQALARAGQALLEGLN